MATYGYVPVLKGKRGEFRALEEMDAADCHRLRPLVEVPPIQWDYDAECPAKTVDAHLASLPDQLTRAWPHKGAFSLDLGLLPDDDRMADSTHPLTFVLDAARDRGLPVVPVSGLARPKVFHSAIREAIGRHGSGVCLRLEGDDFDSLPPDLATQLEELLAHYGTPREEVDLVLDFGELTDGTAGLVLQFVFAFVNTDPHIGEWRSLAVTGSAFPETLGSLEADSISIIPRIEWQTWKKLRSKEASLARLPDFGDYAIANPALAEVDFRLMRMSANLRYTTGDDWMVLRGRNVRDYGFEQFNDLCQKLLERREYAGPDFSWGDAYIARCAEGSDGPGNATTWRTVGTSHHLALACRQVASLS